GLAFTAGKGIEIDGSVSTNGGNVQMTANGGTTLGIPSGNIVVNGSIDAQGGNIALQNAGYFNRAANSLRTSGAGSMSLNQNTFLLGPTVQTAVDAISSSNTNTGGDTITLGTGTFGGFTVDRNNVDIKGANAGIAGTGSRGTETSIVGIGGTGVT